MSTELSDELSLEQLQIKQGLDICNELVDRIRVIEAENAALREQLASAENKMNTMIHKDIHDLQMELAGERGYDMMRKLVEINRSCGFLHYGLELLRSGFPTYAEALAAQKAKE